jgi:hypothetical protein
MSPCPAALVLEVSLRQVFDLTVWPPRTVLLMQLKPALIAGFLFCATWLLGTRAVDNSHKSCAARDLHPLR